MKNGSLALARLAARITLVDTVQAPATADDDVSWLLNFNGCAYLHLVIFS